MSRLRPTSRRRTPLPRLPAVRPPHRRRRKLYRLRGGAHRHGTTRARIDPPNCPTPPLPSSPRGASAPVIYTADWTRPNGAWAFSCPTRPSEIPSIAHRAHPQGRCLLLRKRLSRRRCLVSCARCLSREVSTGWAVQWGRAAASCPVAAPVSYEPRSGSANPSRKRSSPAPRIHFRRRRRLRSADKSAV